MSTPDVRALNRVLRVFNTGAFHCGVEVYNQEWSYRRTKTKKTGVFSVNPRRCPGANYCESVDMGMTFLSHEQIADVIKVLSSEWQGTAYDLLKLNCCHFCDVFCTRLGVGH